MVIVDNYQQSVNYNVSYSDQYAYSGATKDYRSRTNNSVRFSGVELLNQATTRSRVKYRGTSEKSLLPIDSKPGAYMIDNDGAANERLDPYSPHVSATMNVDRQTMNGYQDKEAYVIMNGTVGADTHFEEGSSIVVNLAKILKGAVILTSNVLDISPYTKRFVVMAVGLLLPDWSDDYSITVTWRLKHAGFVDQATDTLDVSIVATISAGRGITSWLLPPPATALNAGHLRAAEDSADEEDFVVL